MSKKPLKLHIGRIYLIECRQTPSDPDWEEDFLVRLKRTPVGSSIIWKPGDLKFDVLAARPRKESESHSPLEPLRVEAKYIPTLPISEVRPEELPTFLHFPYRSLAFDRALKGEI